MLQQFKHKNVAESKHKIVNRHKELKRTYRPGKSHSTKVNSVFSEDPTAT
jgi:hypothetical protein